jgi:hypothetical protein
MRTPTGGIKARDNAAFGVQPQGCAVAKSIGGKAPTAASRA